MYEPPPPRQKKTSITRSRTGCMPCRRKKRKCDEGSPSCGLCSRLGIRCYSQNPQLRFQGVSLNSGRTVEADNNGHDCKSALFTRGSHQSAPILHNRTTNDGLYPNQASRSDRLHMLNIPQTTKKSDIWKQQSHTNRILQPETLIKSGRLYLSQYFVHIVDSLPKAVRPVVSRVSELPAFREAALAFSAARFAYSMGDSYEEPSKKLLLLRPHRHLFIQSLDYFSRAIQLIQPGTGQVEDMLAAVIFIILFENVLGTVTSYHCHLIGLETLALRHHHALSETPYGQLLLRASLFIRAKGFLFLGPLRALPSNDVADRELKLLAHKICALQEHLFLIVADAVRISSSLLLGKCAQSNCESQELVFRKVAISGYSEGHLLEGLHTEFESYQKLESLRRNLDTVFAQSTSLYNAFVRCSTNHRVFQQTELSWTADDIPPIKFDSHEEAIACAIYALVQIYCDRQPLWHLLRAKTGMPSLSLTHWARIILGISKGCAPLRYLYEETYNMNMCWILGLLCLRWPNSDILNYLTQHVLPPLQSTRPAPEDTAGALLLFELVMGMLEAENARGRKVFSIHLVHESSSKENGFFLVNQSLHFAIHGHTNNGSFFNDYMSAMP